jgi:hypothetical protein
MGNSAVPSEAMRHLYETRREWAPRASADGAFAQHPNTPVDILRELVTHPMKIIAETAANRLAWHDPDSVHTEFVHTKFGTNKMRILRDEVEKLGGEATPKQLLPGLVQAVGKAGKLPNGNYSAKLLQSAIDQAPSVKYNISHSTWDGAQRHSNTDSRVLQVNTTTDMINKMKAVGVHDTFRKLNEFTSSAHPVGKAGIGWIRYTGTEKGIHIDEIQSDMGQEFSRQMGSAIDAAVARGELTPEQGAERKAGVEKDYPEAHLKSIQQILFGGKHPSEMLFESFLEWARSMKNLGPLEQKAEGYECHACGEKFEDPDFDDAADDASDAFCPGCGSYSIDYHAGHGVPLAGFKQLIGSPVHIWTTESKAPISGWNTNKPMPKHAIIGYKEAPVKAGFVPGRYGELPTQNNKNYGSSLAGDATFKEQIRKSNKVTSLATLRKNASTKGTKLQKTESPRTAQTEKGTIIKRSKLGVGKDIGGSIYLHRNYENHVPDQVALSRAKKVLGKNHPGFDYNALKFSKNGNFTFFKSPDFDTVHEPTVGEYITVTDGKSKAGKSKSIWHHKWLWVKDDYKGFDVDQSHKRSQSWLKIPKIDFARIGNRAIWEQQYVPRIK